MDNGYDKEKVFQSALKLYKWYITKSYIDVYDRLASTSTYGEDCAYAKRAKDLFFKEEKDREFLLKIEEIYKENFS